MNGNTTFRVMTAEERMIEKSKKLTVENIARKISQYMDRYFDKDVYKFTKTVLVSWDKNYVTNLHANAIVKIFKDAGYNAFVTNLDIIVIALPTDVKEEKKEEKTEKETKESKEEEVRKRKLLEEQRELEEFRRYKRAKEQEEKRKAEEEERRKKEAKEREEKERLKYQREFEEYRKKKKAEEEEERREAERKAYEEQERRREEAEERRRLEFTPATVPGFSNMAKQLDWWRGRL